MAILEKSNPSYVFAFKNRLIWPFLEKWPFLTKFNFIWTWYLGEREVPKPNREVPLPVSISKNFKISKLKFPYFISSGRFDVLILFIQVHQKCKLQLNCCPISHVISSDWIKTSFWDYWNYSKVFENLKFLPFCWTSKMMSSYEFRMSRDIGLWNLEIFNWSHFP